MFLSCISFPYISACLFADLSLTETYVELKLGIEKLCWYFCFVVYFVINVYVLEWLIGKNMAS